MAIFIFAQRIYSMSEIIIPLVTILRMSEFEINGCDFPDFPVLTSSLSFQHGQATGDTTSSEFNIRKYSTCDS